MIYKVLARVFYMKCFSVYGGGRYSTGYSPRFLISFIENPYSLSYIFIGDFADLGLLLIFRI